MRSRQRIEVQKKRKERGRGMRGEEGGEGKGEETGRGRRGTVSKFSSSKSGRLLN